MMFILKNTNHTLKKFVIISIVLTLCFMSCEKLELLKKPTVNTVKVENRTTTTITATGEFPDLNKNDIIEYGFCWSQDNNPTIAEDFISLDLNSLNNIFIYRIHGLVPGQVYYLNAFASNEIGVSYGEEISFTTENKNAIIITSEITNITASTASCGGNVLDNGGSEITAKGICWSLDKDPTVSGDHTTDGTGTGVFTSQLIDLNVNSLYYVRAYATNANGTYYGSELSFTTENGLPTLITNDVNEITATTAVCGGNISDNGGFDITSRGVCWNTSSNPTIADIYTNDGSGTGSFVSNITGLSEWSTYYVRSYATNEIGTVYGDEIMFTANNPLIDFDGNTYETVKIGNQVWMKENLKTSHYADGSALVDGAAAGYIAGDYDTKYFFVYNNNDSNKDAYGYLYTWAAIMNDDLGSDENPSGVQGVCPDNWHIPSDAEWKELEMFLGMSEDEANATAWRGLDVGDKLKAINGWNSGGNGTDESGFMSLPSGSRNSDGTFIDLGGRATYWSSSEYYNSNAWYRELSYSYIEAYRSFKFKTNGCSVRCIKD